MLRNNVRKINAPQQRAGYSACQDGSIFEEEEVGPSLVDRGRDDFSDGPSHVENTFGPINEEMCHMSQLNETINHTPASESFHNPQVDKELDDLISFDGCKTDGGLAEDKNKSWIQSMVGKDSPSFIGASGGIMSIWNSSVSCVEQKLVDRNYLAILGRWSEISRSVGFVNVYAPQANADKEVLWASLDVLINSLDAIWVVFGDFNAVRSREERMGCIFDDAEAYSFSDFITRVGLIDLPLGGGVDDLRDLTKEGKKQVN
nr:hypothetical protein [Tanacetum cinerariifolium]